MISTTTLFALDGKQALVTGASAGIGEMIAHGLADAGATVYVCSRTPDACRSTVAAIRSRGGDAQALPADISHPDECRALARRVGDLTSRLDVLVNNAGTNWVAPLATYPDNAWHKVLDVNLKAPFTLVQSHLQLLEEAGRQSGPARVINVGSISGLRPSTVESYAYAASKAGLHHLTRMLAHHVASANVTVNAVAPGWFPSRMSRSVLANPESHKQILAACPLGRLGDPEDISGTVQFLASRAGAYVTGQVIAVDGGLSNNPWPS